MRLRALLVLQMLALHLLARQELTKCQSALAALDIQVQFLDPVWLAVRVRQVAIKLLQVIVVLASIAFKESICLCR